MNIELLIYLLLLIFTTQALKCGPEYGECPAGQCCSKKGYCGTTTDFCSPSNGCQSEYGDCRCGDDFGECPTGQCCSEKGYCGTTSSYCLSINGCQSEFGVCKCGSELGSCDAGRCCSNKGYCGTTSSYCSISKGCQSEFGECKCGSNEGKCPNNQCCSKDGYCGKTEAHCSISNGCQSEFGICRCGPEYGECPTGQCCSKKGYCGTTSSYCLSINGCQSEFGVCKCGDELGICNADRCCSKKGYCGTTTDYCSVSSGCQSEFGECRCGPEYGECPAGQCCSKDGYCGRTSTHCSINNGCQSEFGTCKCGSEHGKCPAGQCCSEKGYCGTTTSFCSISNGCQSEFGECRCGPKYGECPAGQCCSKDGYCGKTADHCSPSNGCQSEFGDCRCGSDFGNCEDGQCCSKKGYCGKTSSYCSSAGGCQSEFGVCKCGGNLGVCGNGQCCSKKGYCGTTEAYCFSSNGCQSEFGECKCGSEYGECSDNQCCNKKGFCGKTKDFCAVSDGCQSEFGVCRCGPEYGDCPAGQCCSKKGYCGTTTSFCSSASGCQSEYGVCKCGGDLGICDASRCCSKKGYCGTSSTFCSITNGCQLNYGRCMNYVPEVMKESNAELLNPYRGWYHGFYVVDLTDKADTDCNFIYVFGKVRKFEPGLQLLGVRLSEYYNKSISPEALVFLDNLLNEYRKRKEEIDPTTQVVLRFYYDSGEYDEPERTPSPSSPLSDKNSLNSYNSKIEQSLFEKKELDDGELYITEEDMTYMKDVFNPDIDNGIVLDKRDSNNNNNSTEENGEFVFIEKNNCYKYIPTDLEPESVDTIIGHINQLAGIVNKYKDIIYIYQGVFVGRWGEMHSTDHANSLDSCTKIMNTLNNKIDPSIYLAVRTPCHYRGISSEIKKLNNENYKKLINRLSLFNDGLFRTELDTGTYGGYQTCFEDDNNNLYVKKSRVEEVEFQKELCLKVPNGGEVISNSDEDKYEKIYKLADIKKAIASPDNYNNFYVCEDHSKNIHLSYINDQYDCELYKRWNTTFSKQTSKPLWKKVSGEDYMGRHLGYRYVLRESLFEKNILNITLENIGFSPAYKSFQSELLLNSSSSNHTITVDIEIDNKNWPINENITLTVNIEDAFSQFNSDNYDVYFNLYDPNLKYDIRFANTSKYNENYGYKIGRLTSEENN